MGEKESARGYLYQAMACVLGAVREDSRVCVQFEPDFTAETVDIAFQYRDNTLKAVRVKAWAPVTEANVFESLQSLTAHTPGASLYQLIWIGGCPDKTRESIARSVREKAARPGGGIAVELAVDILDNDFGHFESELISELGLLLGSQGISADAAQLQFIISAICYRFNQFSTNSRFIPGRAFVRKLSDWVELYSPDAPEYPGDQTGLKLQFYYDHRFSGAGGPIKPGLIRSGLFRQKMTELRGLCREIKGIPLPPKPARQPSPADQVTNMFCEYAEELQTGIREKARAILRLDLPDGFFHVGGLKRKSPMLLPTGLWDTPAGCDGTPVELDKYHKLERFAQGLDYLEGLLRVFVFLDRYDIVPLVLCNAGDRFDRQIKVRLELPREAALLTESAFPQPALCVMADLTGEEGLLHRFLKQESDEQVTQYHVSYYPPAHFSYLYIGPQRAEQEARELRGDFAAYLQSVFRFELSDDGPHCRTLEIEFEEIKPGQNIAFPCFLFVQCKKGFTIKYRITSKELAAPHRGRLEYGV